MFCNPAGDGDGGGAAAHHDGSIVAHAGGEAGALQRDVGGAHQQHLRQVSPLGCSKRPIMVWPPSRQPVLSQRQKTKTKKSKPSCGF